MGARGKSSVAQAYVKPNQRGLWNPAATRSRDRNQCPRARVSANNEQAGSPLILVGLVLWLLVCFMAGLLLGRLTKRRSVFWLSFIVIFLLPWTNTIIGTYVAKSYYSRFGRLMPEAPITVSGFLYAVDRDSAHPAMYYFLTTRGFDFVEIEYSRSIYETPSLASGPGFYQFRLAPSSVADCATAGVSGKPVGVFATGGHCYSYTRSDFPISRYAYHRDGRKSLRSNVEVFCRRLIDLRNEQDVARSCVVDIYTLYGFRWEQIASPESPDEVLAVLQPQPSLSNQLDGELD